MQLESLVTHWLAQPGDARKTLVIQIVDAWLRSGSGGSAEEQALSALITSSSGSRSRLQMIDEEVSTRLVVALKTANTQLAASQAAVSFLRIHPTSTKLVDELVDELRSHRCSDELRSGLALMARSSEAAGVNLIQRLIDQRIADFKSGGAPWSQGPRLAVAAVALNDVRALARLLIISPYRGPCVAAFASADAHA